jgi:hypothetical protein
MQMFTLRHAATLLSIIGQSESYYEGFFGPFPVHSYPDHLSLAYAFILNDDMDLVKDPRQKGRAYCILTILLRKANEEAFLLRKSFIEKRLIAFLSPLQNISQIDQELLAVMEQELDTLLQRSLVTTGAKGIEITSKLTNRRTDEIRSGLDTISGSKTKLFWTALDCFCNSTANQNPGAMEYFRAVNDLFFDRVFSMETKKRHVLKMARGNLELAVSQVHDVQDLEEKSKNIKKSTGVICFFPEEERGNLLQFLDALIALLKDKTSVCICTPGKDSDSALMNLKVLLEKLVPSHSRFNLTFNFFKIESSQDPVIRSFLWLLNRNLEDLGA